MNAKGVPRVAAILNDVTIAYVYSFSFKKVNSRKVIEALSKRSYVNRWVCPPDSLVSKTKTKSSILDELLRYDKTYYFPEYLCSGRISYVELSDLELHIKGTTLKAHVFLSLHEYGVGNLIFTFPNINGISFGDLRDLIFLNNIEGEYISCSKSSSGKGSAKNTSNLTSIFRKLLSLLEEETNIEVVKNSAANFRSTMSPLTISEEDYNLYVCVFISDPGAAFNTPAEFVEKNEKAVFELVAIRFHQKDSEKYYFSRNDAYIKSITSKLLGNRRHISYYITEERMTAISLAKYHPELYPYDFEWWVGYLSLLNIVRMQFQLLFKLYKLLYIREVGENPTKMIELRQIIMNGLEEYHNLRFPVNERTREFVEHSKEAMNLTRFYDVIQEKLNLFSQSIEEYFDRESQIKSEVTTSAVNLLTIILSLSTAIEIVDKFVVDPKIYHYVSAWLVIGASYFIVQKIFLWIRSRPLRKVRKWS